MLYVEVMYADTFKGKRIRHRVPLREIGKLRKTGVLFINIQDDSSDRQSRNVAWKQGFDHYILATREMPQGMQVLLNGWDDGDWTWNRVGTDPVETAPPLGELNVVFHGEAVTDTEWEAALSEANGLL